MIFPGRQFIMITLRCAMAHNLLITAMHFFCIILTASLFYLHLFYIFCVILTASLFYLHLFYRLLTGTLASNK